MAIILPDGLTSAEIRVLQEFRRTNNDTMTLEAIKAIKHPTGGGEAPAIALVRKGYLEAVEREVSVTTTQKAKDLLSFDPVPLVESTSDAAASSAVNPDADGV